MSPTTTAEAIARALLDARRQNAHDLADELAALIGEASRLRTAAVRIEQHPEHPDEEAALDIAARLAALSPRTERPRARVEHLVARARELAVDLARASGASWQDVGDALVMGRENASTVYGKGRGGGDER